MSWLIATGPFTHLLESGLCPSEERLQMKSHTSKSSDVFGSLPDQQDFSLVLGGPLFQLLRRAHLSDNALTLARQRIIVISLLAWLPLLVLSAMEGKALGGSAAVPFLLDIDVHVRFLVAMPLLIAAELVVHRRMRSLLKGFLERQLIPESAMARFDAAIASLLRLRNSVLAEVLLIALVYGVGILIIWRQYLGLGTVTWYATPSVGGSKLSFAGMWYGYVSLPIFQFLLCRWYFRIFIWMRFLWHVSRIELSLVPTHPDRIGGLGFLTNTVYAFTLLALAHGALLAGLLANMVRWPSVTCAGSMRNGYAAARLPMSRWWVAATSSLWPILAIVSRSFGPCASRLSRKRTSFISWLPHSRRLCRWHSP
jgi:hypothetical protein